MEVPNKKNITRLVLEAYGTHMEIHMEIIFPSLMSLTSIWNHMEVIWKSYGSPEQNKMLLGSIWKHMEVIWKSYESPKPPKGVTRLVLEAYGTHMEIHMEIIFPCFMLLTSIWNH